MIENRYIPHVTAQDVLRIVSRDFPEHQRAAVLAGLDGYGVAAWHRERERVLAAVLKLSAGNPDQVSKYLETAKSDFREVIGPAETPRFVQLFCSARRMSDRELEQLKSDDWAEYIEWLNRAC
jgi:hypothetical protein